MTNVFDFSYNLTLILMVKIYIFEENKIKQKKPVEKICHNKIHDFKKANEDK